MHPRILAQRNAEASNRTVAAATKLAKRFDLEEEAKALKAEEKQPDIQQLVRNEAVAAFLETLNKTLAADDKQRADDLEAAKMEAETALLARIEALEGIGPAAIELIRKGLAPAPAEAEIPKGKPAEAEAKKKGA